VLIDAHFHVFNMTYSLHRQRGSRRQPASCSCRKRSEISTSPTLRCKLLAGRYISRRKDTRALPQVFGEANGGSHDMRIKLLVAAISHDVRPLAAGSADR
jgi:hypothetical protein